MAREKSDLQIGYYFQRSWIVREGEREKHARILELLDKVKAAGRIERFEVQDQDEAFPTEVEKAALLSQMRDFAMRRHTALRFGSNNYPYSLLPVSFMLVHRGPDLQSVFPCEVDRQTLEPEYFLERLLAGEPWIPSRARSGGDTRHKYIVEYLARHPEILEPGLIHRGSEQPVWDSSGESGRVDLSFTDLRGLYLIVEVKLGPTELDKASGQIRRHRRLFAETNHIAASQIRIGVACQYFPKSRIVEFEEVGIRCFPLPDGDFPPE
jgi:hypothetical protein